MFITLARPLEVLEASRTREDRQAKSTILPGRHKFVIIPNIYKSGSDLWVLEGTKVGAADSFWQFFAESTSEWQVLIEE